MAQRSLKHFFTKSWPDEPFLVHAPPSRLEGLADARELASIDALAKIPCHAVLAQGQHLDTNRFGNIAVAPELASSLLRAGVTMYFNEPKFPSRSVWRWVHAVERDLGLGPGSIRPSVFFSTPGPGARMHFDCTESFVVQLAGRKEWRIAANEHIPFPPVNYLEGAPLPDELALLTKRPMKAPKKVRTVVLKPGSVLYLPRGWWHATRTLEASTHLDLLTAVPTWADTFRPVLEALFAQGTHWLTPATAPRFGPAMLEKLIDELRGRLE
ncbi:MAG: cupin domain-containing protein [Archangium sp.]|nr:cupin domain-containing protein [Archangium sp.]